MLRCNGHIVVHIGVGVFFGACRMCSASSLHLAEVSAAKPALWRAAVAGRAAIDDINAVKAAVLASRKPGQTGRYFVEG